jgi:toluene monooxygenase electron transfer component
VTNPEPYGSPEPPGSTAARTSGPATTPGRTYRVTLAGTGESFEVPAGGRIHAAARRAGVWLPFECGWGGCGTCKATLVEGETELLLPQAPAVGPRDAQRRRILLCQNTPVTDVVIKALRVDHEPPAERPTVDVRGRLAEVILLGPSIARFRFDLFTPDGVPTTARYRPGQFAVLDLAPGLRRCYSMAGPPDGTRVEFVAKRYPGGAGSTRLFGLEPGSEIALELPYGDLWLRDGERPLLLVAGGTGVSAVLALLHGLANRPGAAARDVHVFYGAATRAELVCWDDLERLAERIPRAHLHGALLTPDDAWTATRGPVTDALAAALPRLSDGEAYLAGPPPMVAAVRTLLDDHGVSVDRIHVDSFG